MKKLNPNESKVTEEFKKFEENRAEDVPSGYIPIELSTQGLLGAPKLFHVRNFDTKHIVDLALSDDEDLPEKVVSLVDNLILEDISARDFHEKEVIELLVIMYKTFFSSQLENIDFQYTDEELEDYIKIHGRESQLVEGIISGKRKPKTNIDLNNVTTYDIDPSTFRNRIRITDKRGFSVAFSYPRFGDILVVREFLKEHYQKEDRRFDNVKRILKFREESEKKIQRGEDVSYNKIPNITESDREELKIYEMEKALLSIDFIRALHLREFNGQDVSKSPIYERIEIIRDPRFDINITKKIEKYFSETMKIGVKEEILMFNPWKNTEEIRRFSFRLLDILQAVQLFESDDYDIELEFENS